MSVYGDLSKAQRAMMEALFSDISGERAVSIETAHFVDGKRRQTAASLRHKGFVEVHPDRWGSNWSQRVFLTPAGVDLMRSLDFRHARVRTAVSNR